jgi:hypothetical protein
MCLLVLFSGRTAFGADRIHRVEAGESASSIARFYYGDYELADLLVEYNGGGDAAKIRVDQRLKIPICPEHRVRAGDAWSVLAERYVDRGDVWPSIAILNGMLPEKPLTIGTRIVFPVVMPHTLSRGETLAVLARRYYGDPERADVLQQFNAIDDPRRLSVGQTIDVPLIDFRAAGKPAETDPPPPAERAKRDLAATAGGEEATVVEKRAEPKIPPAEPEPEKPAGLPFAEPLARAADAIDRGEFERARTTIESLLERVEAAGTDEAKTRLWEMAATLYVAYDEPQRACEAFRKLAALPAEPDLDPDRVSPKIRRAWSDCRR